MKVIPCRKQLATAIAAMVMQLVAVQSFCQATNSFGNKDWVSNGLAGKIYALAENTSSLPDFDTMRSLGTIYSKEINVPNRSWTEGFPGVTDRFEWFGIEYKGSFTVKKPGHYWFQLVSDDGSKLFIDDKLIINDDGLHSFYPKSGETVLDNSTHKIKIQYFQGPRNEIGLQLFVQRDSADQEIFPGKSFTLFTPHKAYLLGLTQPTIVILFFILLTILFVIIKWRRRQKLFAR